jgi:acyl-[acyl-carrier-protein]-phospholipid O-acyltransferase/long-chain-fatty-acid--[acyl-carrier-protein] ligase
MTLPNAELMKLISPASWDDPHRTAIVLFSSGSTGIPKGIMLSHHNIFSDVLAVSRSIAWTRKDRVPGNLPLFHSFGMAVCLWMPMYSGSEVVMLPNPLDASGMSKVLRQHQSSVLFATPSFLQLYMRKCQGEDFKSLRLVIAGAEKLRDDIAAKFHQMTGLVIAEAYGCTELSPVVSINLAHSVMDLGVTVARQGSIGPSLPGICAKIVDPSTFELLPEECDGLLLVKGAIVMQGYLNDPEKTSEVIRDQWYVTGDIGHMDRNRFITLTGRLSRFSKIAGEMVPHELVEREINNILQPDHRILAVAGAPDADKGEKLIVFYTDSELLAPEQVVRWLRERKIPNLWIPKSENFIKVDELPMLGSGKLDLARLKAMAAK